MRPRLILLLLLLAITVVFMAFLVKDQRQGKMVCAQGTCGKQTQTPKPVETSGGGEMDNGSFHHLIVSTIK